MSAMAHFGENIVWLSLSLKFERGERLFTYWVERANEAPEQGWLLDIAGDQVQLSFTQLCWPKERLQAYIAEKLQDSLLREVQNLREQADALYERRHQLTPEKLFPQDPALP